MYSAEKHFKLMTLLLVLLMTSCHWFIEGTHEITHRANLLEVENKDSQLKISVAEMRFYHADKRVSYTTAHDWLSLHLELKIRNPYDSTLRFKIRNGEWYRDTNFFGVFEFKGQQHTIKLLTEQVRDKNYILIPPRSMINLSIGTSDPFDFRHFFSKKNNYTNDMLDVLSSLCLYYIDDPQISTGQEPFDLKNEFAQRIEITKDVKVFVRN